MYSKCIVLLKIPNSWVHARARFHFLSFPTAECLKALPRHDLDTRLLCLVRQTASGAGLSRRRELTYFLRSLCLPLPLSFRSLPYSSLRYCIKYRRRLCRYWIICKGKYENYRKKERCRNTCINKLRSNNKRRTLKIYSAMII